MNITKISSLAAIGVSILLSISCKPSSKTAAVPPDDASQKTELKAEAKASPASSMVLLHVTNQGYRYDAPWNKKEMSYSHGFAIYLGDGLFLTNAEIIADSSFLELLSPDGDKTVIGKVKAADYEANLAILQIEGNVSREFTENLVPVQLADTPKLGDQIEVWQFNDDGLPITATGTLESTQLTVPYCLNIPWVVYQIKTSVTPITGGATMPILIGGKLAGLSTSYDSSDQSLLALPVSAIKSFLERAKDEKGYQGIPGFGIEPTELMDPVFKKYLKLNESDAGLYVLKLTPHSSADQAGIKKGDVIESVDGMAIDGRGIIRDEKLGPVNCSMYLHDLRKVGDTIEVGIRRNGSPMKIKVTMTRDGFTQNIIPGGYETSQPRYVVYGGLVFQPLSEMLLLEVFESNQNKMPLGLIEALNDKDKYAKEGRKEIIYLSQVLPTPATHGYADYSGAIVKKVDGQIPVDIKHLHSLIEAAANKDIIEIETNKAPYVIYFSPKDAKTSDDYIRQVAFPKLINL